MDESCIPKVFIIVSSRTARHKRMKQYKEIKVKNNFSLTNLSFSSDSAVAGL